MIEKINLRVYGLLLRGQHEVLVTDEIRWGKSFTKFPGGGLILGEGLGDCIRREFMEEAGLVVNPTQLFYANDFFQASAFNSKEQLISMYYFIDCPEIEKLPIYKDRFSFEEMKEGSLIFRWQSLKNAEAEMTFPVDKVVCQELLLRFG
ncbi:MAG: NUDIX domain-containing protein [Sphingobacteriia bacterium]|nr:NUDIX domain-containing protein [Sphingobacteriia bacterium]